jgi:glutathione S-transferase
MIKLYHGAMTRSVRILWLLEELGIPYELKTVPFVPPSTGPYQQQTPSGKLPVIEDDGMTIAESGAILEYVIDRYGKGRLAPPPGSKERGPFLQWVHFAEATAFPALATIAVNTMFKPEAERIPAAVDDARKAAAANLDVLERALAGKEYILGPELSGADIMLGYTLMATQFLGALDDAHPNCQAYYARLAARPGFQKALAAA